MKIISIDIIRLATVESAAMRSVIVRVNTDDGVYGLGEIGVAIVYGATGALEVIKDYAPLLIGRDPFDTEVIWDKLHRETFWAIGNGAIVMSAISAIDTALWDLKAKALNMPLYRLLGGKQRDSLRAYASQLQFGWRVPGMTPQFKPKDFGEMTRRAVEEGYDAVKANIISTNIDGRSNTPRDSCGLLTREYMALAKERLSAMREAAGAKVDIILENHAATDAVSAVRLANMAEPYDILFMEEAANPLCTDSFKKIAAGTSIPLATGERSYTRWGFMPLIASGSLAVIQPDIGNCGGVSEFMKIAAIAHACDVSVQAHVCSSPISVAVSLQAEAAIPNFAIHEHHVTNTTQEVRDMCVNDYQPVNGSFSIPELPGIGQDISKEALKKAEIVTVG